MGLLCIVVSYSFSVSCNLCTVCFYRLCIVVYCFPSVGILCISVSIYFFVCMLIYPSNRHDLSQRYLYVITKLNLSLHRTLFNLTHTRVVASDTPAPCPLPVPLNTAGIVQQTQPRLLLCDRRGMALRCAMSSTCRLCLVMTR